MIILFHLILALTVTQCPDGPRLDCDTPCGGRWRILETQDFYLWHVEACGVEWTPVHITVQPENRPQAFYFADFIIF